MFEIMRKNHRTILTVVAVLVIFTMIFWGSTVTRTGGDGSETSQTVGNFFDRPLTIKEVRDAQKMVVLQVILNGQSPAWLYENPQEFENSTRKTLLLQNAIKELNLRASDEDVVKEISTNLKNNPTFMTDGKFDQEKFSNFLKQSGVTEKDLENAARHSVSSQKLLDRLKTYAKVTPQEVRERYHFEKDQHSFAFIEYPFTNFTSKVTVTTNEIASFFESNRKDYEIPAKTKVKYLAFSFSNYLGKVNVTDEQLRKYYDSNKDYLSFLAKEEQSNAKAPKAKDQDLTSFEALKPVATKQLKEELARNEVNQNIQKVMQEISKKLDADQKPDLAAMAKAYQAKVHETGFISDQDEIPGVEYDNIFTSAAAQLSDRNPVSEPVPDANGTYLLMFVDRLEKRPANLEEVKEKVTNQVKLNKASQLAMQEATAEREKFAKLIEEGKSLDEAAKAIQNKPIKMQDKTKNDDWEKCEAAKRHVLITKEGKVSELVQDDDAFGFVHVISHKHPSDEQFKKDLAEFEKETLSNKENMIVSEWMQNYERQGFGGPSAMN